MTPVANPSDYAALLAAVPVSEAQRQRAVFLLKAYFDRIPPDVEVIRVDDGGGNLTAGAVVAGLRVLDPRVTYIMLQVAWDPRFLRRGDEAPVWTAASAARFWGRPGGVPARCVYEPAAGSE